METSVNEDNDLPDDIEEFEGQPIACSTLKSNEMNAAWNKVPSAFLKSLRIILLDSSSNSSNDMATAPDDFEFHELPEETQAR